MYVINMDIHIKYTCGILMSYTILQLRNCGFLSKPMKLYFAVALDLFVYII